MSEFDTMLRVLENPTRRRILRRLTVETHYPLQLAKELKVSPQAVMKHLEILERHGLVRCQRSESSMGPSRKCYFAVKRVSLRLDMAPNLFETRVRELAREDLKRDASSSGADDDPKELLSLQEKLREIDREISVADRQFLELIKTKEKQLDRANRIIRNFFSDYEEREILHYVLTHDDFTLPDLSESLGLREEIIRGVLKRLSEMGLVPQEEH